MKIALIGYGKMGKMIEAAALNHGYTIVAIIDPKGDKKKISKETIGEADVCIDFSLPEHALDNLQQVAKCEKNIVMGTTGWYDNLKIAEKIVHDANIGFIYSPNFSLGVALFLHIIDKAAKIIAPFNHYDVSGVEMHHNQKLDAPSGTAKIISEKLQQHLPNKIDFASVRVGSIPGTHTVLFDSPADTITLTHTARNREGFALGAVKASEWLKDKKGFFTIDDMLRSLYA